MLHRLPGTWVNGMRVALPAIVEKVSVVTGCGDGTVFQVGYSEHITLACQRTLYGNLPGRTVRAFSSPPTSTRWLSMPSASSRLAMRSTACPLAIPGRSNLISSLSFLTALVSRSTSIASEPTSPSFEQWPALRALKLSGDRSPQRH